MRARRRQSGTVYVLVLGIVSLLVVLGLAGAMLARGTIERSTLEQDQAKARLLALSYLDVRHSQIDGYSLWRSFASENAYDSAYTLGDGQVQSMYVDEIDGDLANDSAQRFRIYIKATVGQAVRVYSQEFIPDDSNNLYRNPKSLRQEPAN